MKYFYKYLKYKSKYYKLVGGQLKKQVHILLIDRTGGGIVAPTTLYKKEIIVNSFAKMIVNGVPKDINAVDVIKLLERIKDIWTLQGSRNMEEQTYDGYVLYIKDGDRVWMNGKPTTCVVIASDKKPTEEEKLKFKKITGEIYNFE